MALVAGGQQQSPAQHDRGDAGARLGVRPVGRQLEVVAECLVLVVCAHAAGQVCPAGHGVLPLPADRLQQLVVAEVDGDIDRSGGEVQRAYGVPAERVGLADRHVVLEVRRAELDLSQRSVAASFDEAPSQL